MTTAAQRFANRLAKPWRMVFVVYALALTVATHWPELRLTILTRPAPDKLMHMLCFGLLTTLLWRTRWLTALWSVILIALAWTAFDEITQALPILNRTFSGLDLLASQLGVVVALVWIWALGPIGGPANRTRLACQAFILDDLFLRRRTWIVALAAAGTGAIIMGAVLWLLVRVLSVSGPRDALLAMLGSPLIIATFLFGSVLSMILMLAPMYRRQAHALKDHQPCFECGGSCRGLSLDESGRARCPTCDTPIHRGQWIEAMDLPMSAALRGTWPTALVAFGLFFLAMLTYGSVLSLSAHVTVAKALLHSWQNLSADMQSTVDLAGIVFILAIATRVYRSRQARLHDQQHVRCRGCKHDLRGTPVEQGLGRCGECGRPFARFPHEPEAVSRRG